METNKLVGFINKVEELTKKPEKYLSLQKNEAEAIKLLTKDLYNFTKRKENSKKKVPDVLPELIISNLDEEQIWQQIDLQNNSIYNSLVNDVAHLMAKKDSLKFPLQGKKKKKFQSDEKELISEGKIEKPVTKKNVQKKVRFANVRSVKPSVVDDKFFKLHEMENFLEKIEKEEDHEKEYSDTDYFEDDSSDLSNENENQFYYNDFFDQPEEGFDEKNEEDSDENSEDMEVNENLNFDDFETDDLNDDFDEENEEEREEEEQQISNNFMEMTNDDTDGDNDDNDSDNVNTANEKKQPSNFEARQERIKNRIKVLEEEALKEKPWQLKGEVTANKRPQNSLLEEYVEFDIATRPAPVLTEKSTLKLEDVIIQRIKDKAWDDVVRKIKPVESEIEYKKKLVLDQEKSKLSLAQIYEKEYLQQLESKNEDMAEKQEVEPPEHQEIKGLMDKLFYKLDALSNFHFTPRQILPEVKIVSNLPAINMEEVAPVATSDATLLAPEEVKPKFKGDLIGKSERTKTDKNRQKRQRKLKQKLKFKQMEAKAKLKLEKSGSKNLESNKMSEKLLQKITKSRNVTKLDESESGKYVKSSNAFFSKLQNETSSGIKKKGVEAKKIKLSKKTTPKKSSTR